MLAWYIFHIAVPFTGFGDSGRCPRSCLSAYGQNLCQELVYRHP